RAAGRVGPGGVGADGPGAGVGGRPALGGAGATGGRHGPHPRGGQRPRVRPVRAGGDALRGVRGRRTLRRGTGVNRRSAIMEMDSYENGIPSWVDLGTPDPDAA